MILLKIYKSSIFPILIILLLICSLIFNNLNYTDEIITIILFFILLLKSIFNKLKINREMKIIIVLSIIICLIGIFSTILNSMGSLFYILLDFLSFFKLFICVLAFSQIINEKNAINIVDFLANPVKLLLILGVFFMPISQFVDIGMRTEQRFGFWNFDFIFHYAHVYSSVLLFCMLIVYRSNKIKNKVFYIFLIIIQMISTTKGPSLIWAASIMILMIYMKRKDKISMKAIIILGFLCILLGGYQIENYIMNTTSPRYLFYKYGVITANEYFPLGSGFSTFGSDSAAEEYSPLYIKYGFNNIWGLSREYGMFLNDTYWPMIIGQFGWFSFVLMVIIFYEFFKIIQNLNMNGIDKGILFSIYFYFIIHSLGSAILGSSCSILTFIGIILFIKSGICKERKESISEE